MAHSGARTLGCAFFLWSDMQLPRDERERQKIQNFLRGQKGEPSFESFLAWFRSELQQRDEENRVIGFENTSSEARCLADFLKIVAACQAPKVDRDSSNDGAESETARLAM